MVAKTNYENNGVIILKSFDYEIYDVSPLDNKTDCTGPLTREEFTHYIHKVVDKLIYVC